MQNKKIITAALLCVMTCVILAGCGSKGSAIDYVEGVMDLAYASDSINNKALDMNDDEMNKAKEQSIKAEAEFLAYYFNIENPSDEVLDIFEEACQKLYKAASYSVKGEGMDITVTVKPLKVHTEALDQFVEEFNIKKFVDADQSCTDKAFAEGVSKILGDIAENPEYEDVKTIQFNVVDGNKGDYMISQTDLQAIDEAILLY